MTHLLIAPKKVFKSIYYHKRRFHVFDLYERLTDGLTIGRDSKHVASTRPVLHIPPVVLPTAHLLRMVARLRACLLLGCQACADVHLRAFLSGITGHLSNSILGGGQTARSWCCRSARAQKTARALRPSRRYERSGNTGIRILLRRVYTSLLPSLRVTLHHSVCVDASYRPSEPSVDILRQPALPCGGDLLEPHHLLGLQRTPLSSSYTTLVVANGSLVHRMACVYNPGHQPGEVGNTLVVPRSQRLNITHR